MTLRLLVALAAALGVAASGLACGDGGARLDVGGAGGASDRGAGGDGAGGNGGPPDAGAGGCEAAMIAPPADAGALGAATAACEACELASSAAGCDPGLLSAATDPEGNALGWGVDSLPTETARTTGRALLHCINEHACAANTDNNGPGNNAALGCFCGSGVSVEDCVAAAGVHGPCIVEYEAAATATPTGPPACAPLATYASFIATVSSNWQSPIGIADNVVRCAVNAPCPICAGL